MVEKWYNTYVNTHEISAEKNIEKGVSGTVVVTQMAVDTLIANELKGIVFSAPIKVNNKIGSPGLSSIKIERGRVVNVKMQIGKQGTTGTKYLMDTIIHEELEVRLHKRAYNMGVEKDRLLVDAKDDADLHDYINAVSRRYFRIKGVD